MGWGQTALHRPHSQVEQRTGAGAGGGADRLSPQWEDQQQICKLVGMVWAWGSKTDSETEEGAEERPCSVPAQVRAWGQPPRRKAGWFLVQMPAGGAERILEVLSASVFSGKWEVRSIAKVRMELSGERTVE